MAADWSQLPIDLWSMIGEKLGLAAADWLQFRSVCNPMRSALSFPQPPWLILAQTEKENRDDSAAADPPPRGFVGLGEQQMYPFALPEAHQKRFAGSTGTWLITIDTLGFVHLLNPFSRLQIDLPPQSTFEHGLGGGEITPEWRRDGNLFKVVLSSPPTLSSSSNRNCVAMAIHHYLRKIAIARPGDPSWVTVETPSDLFGDIIFYKEQFYAVTLHGMVMVCDINADWPLHPPKASLLMDRFHLEKFKRDHDTFYLVEWMGELLLVIKLMYLREHKEEEEEAYLANNYVVCEWDEKDPFYFVKTFKVYKLDFINKKWDELKSLGEYSLFLGCNSSISTLAYGRVKKNCIYFTDDYAYGYRGYVTQGGRVMGVFDMENNTIKPHYEGLSICNYSPPMWLVPTSLVNRNTKMHTEKKI